MADNLKIAQRVGQTVKDTGIGAAKGAANIVIDTANAINTDINRVLPGDPIPYGQRFEASTTGESGAMLGVNIAAAVYSLRSGIAAAESLVTTARTAAMANEMRMGPVTEAARTTAEVVRQLPRGQRRNGAGALQTSDGTMFTGTSGRSTVNPLVQNALDRVPQSQRSPFHGKCAEVRLCSQALDSGRSLRGSRISIFSVPRLTPMPPCTSCAHMLRTLRRR